MEKRNQRRREMSGGREMRMRQDRTTSFKTGEAAYPKATGNDLTERES